MAIGVGVGVILGCVCALLFPDGFFRLSGIIAQSSPSLSPTTAAARSSSSTATSLSTSSPTTPAGSRTASQIPPTGPRSAHVCATPIPTKACAAQSATRMASSPTSPPSISTSAICPPSRYLPDKNASNPEASELFKEVTYSYSILSDPEKRRQYDTSGFEALEIEGMDMEIDLSNLGTVNTI